MPTDWKSVYEDTLALLTTSSSDPELQKCRSSVAILFDMSIQKLPAHIETVKSASLENLILTCESLIDLANEEMLAMPYKDVPLSWRRLLTDASLLKAVCHILLIHSPGRTPAEETILRRICNCLDTSIVVAGAPGDDRRVMTDRILNLAQRQLQELNKYRFAESDESFGKRRRIMTDKADSTLNYPLKLREKSPSFMEFCDYINADDVKPFILDNIIDHWPALNDHPWASTRYLLSVAGERLVPVELGSQYTETSWSQRLMPFREFVESYIEKGKDENVDVAYLAQHDLFHQIPRLQEDIVVPDYCYVSPKLTQYYERQPSDIVTNAWFGPGGTISPLHHDPYHNLLAQVVGSKYIRLYSPEQSAKLYPHTGMMSNTSQVQVENVDEGLFPEFKNVPYTECILKAGQVLYIPPKWWHYVRSLETSFSVSFWF